MPPLNAAFVPHLGREFKFHDRSAMRPPFVGRAARLPRTDTWQVPTTALPVDSTGDAKVSCPIDGNDTWGDCGAAMVAHADNILTFRQGAATQSAFDTRALVNQYLRVSGGDNGLMENQVVEGIWKVGIAGNKEAIIVDALDIDMTDEALVTFCIDQFYTVQMGWSVPDRFINGFATGSVWANPGIPNPRHGHYTPLADVAGPATPIPDVGPTGGGRAVIGEIAEMIIKSANGQSLAGFRRIWTWGGWAWISQAFINSVNPDGFVAFSPRQFDATGHDSKGRHITTQAALWAKMGGHAISPTLLAKYPAPVARPTYDWSSWE